ncbi:MAG: VCBS repeat-containing protein [Clostridia bacterium]|nr:VCBS repeat-containing protein [Clostridia bacterium]
MVKRITAAAALLLMFVLCTMLSGCSVKFSQISDLIRPPVYSRENEELRKAFKADFSAEAVYKAPISGEYLSAFLTYDINSDGTQEALVFYSDDAFDNTVSIAVYGRQNGEWHLSSQTDGNGCDVYSVEFEDFDLDGAVELVVCWSLFDSKSNKMLSVYSVNKETLSLQRLTAEMYTVKEFVDIDGDSDNEIFLIHLDATSGKQESSAKLMGMTDSGFALIEKRSLDGNVSGYKGIITEHKDGSVTFFIDAYKGENQMITEVVTWNTLTSAMNVPLLDSETRMNTQSWRSMRLFCTDINGDSRLEIPTQEVFENGEIWTDGSEQPTYPFLTTWFTIENDTPETVGRTLVNLGERCLFTIPDMWEDRFAVTMHEGEGKWDFYQINPYTGEKKSYLFSVVFLTKDAWESDGSSKYESYMLLKETDNKCLAVTGINTENELNVSFDMLSRAFSYFSQ